MLPQAPSQPVAHSSMSTAPLPMDMATTLSLCLDERAATKPPTNMPAALHSM